MEKEKLSKKQIIPLVIGVLTMIILVSSATYAYFKVSIGNTATSTTITGDIGGDTIGTVTLSGGGSELYLGVSADDMSESNKGTTYYSSTTEGNRETNVNNAGKTTYTATLSGDDTDEIMYACDYEFTITSSGTALGKEHTSDISVVFEGDIKKIIPLSASETVSGTWFGFKNSNKERAFNAYLQLANTDDEQNSLAGTNLSVSISNTKWDCYLSENDELVGEAYALLTVNANANDFYDLTFVRSETPYNVGDMYNGVEVLEIYTGFEDSQYTSYSDVPWISGDNSIINVSFKDEIRPKSTAWWFYNIGAVDNNYYYEGDNINMNLTKLNTSLVVNMSHMFGDGLSGSGKSLNLIGYENWDTGKVTDMSFMFNSDRNSLTSLDLSNWNVSNVTNMSYMFGMQYMLTTVGDLSNWDVSNVTNMSGMFSGMNINTDYGLKKWDVSNVISMSWMFDMSDINVFIDLSNWDVSNVENMTCMFETASATKSSNIGNLSKWNVSKVTDMSAMFAVVTFDQDIGLKQWNVSNVTDMSWMFMGATINVDLNLSGWDVSNVSDYSDFNISIRGTGTLTPPNWPTT